MTIKNALIESIILDDGDRGLLTGWLMLDYGDSSHQGFGGHALYLSKDYDHHGDRGYAGHWIFRCMQIAGVNSWDKIKGRTIRVKLDSDRLQANIIAIGHIIKDDWFNPEEEFKALKHQTES